MSRLARAGRFLISASVLFLLLSSRLVIAGITLDSQFRQLTAEASANVTGSTPPDSLEQITAPDFSVFVDDAFANVIADNGLANGSAMSSAEQESLIQHISAEALGIGQVDLSRTGGGVNEGGAFGSAVSDYVYQFTLDSPTNYEVLGDVSVFGVDTEGFVELRRADTTEVFRIFAASTATVDDDDFIAGSGQLSAGSYTLSAQVDVAHGIVGIPGGGLTTAGGEFGFGFALDLVWPGEVINSHFTIGNDLTGEIFRWEKTGLGPVQLVDVGPAGEETVVQLETASPVGIVQNVDTFSGPFAIEFDYQFLDTSGGLDVVLGGQTVLSLPAPATLATQLQRATVVVNNPALLGLIGTPLQLVFDGPTAGLQLQLDNLFVRLAGDLNGDGTVDGNDLSAWSNAYGSSSAGDADGDGDSDGADFLLWQQQASGNPGPLAASQSVPEPSVIVLMVLGLAVSWVQKRRFQPCFA